MSEFLDAYRAKHPEYDKVPEATLVTALYQQSAAGKMSPNAFLNMIYHPTTIGDAEKADLQKTADAAVGPNVPAGAPDLKRLAITLADSANTLNARTSKVMGIPGSDQMLANAARNRELTAPLTGFSAGAGRAIVPGLLTAPAGGGIGANILAGAGAGALTADNPTVGAVGGGIGGGIGAGLGQLMGRTANGMRGDFATRTMQGEGDIPGLMQQAQDETGYRFTGSAANPESKVRGGTDWMMSRLPFVSNAYHDTVSLNDSLANRDAMGMLRVDATKVSGSALEEAKKGLNQRFEDVIAQSPPQINLSPDSTVLRTKRVSDEFINKVKSVVSKPFMEAHGGEIANGTASPRTFLALHSELADVARSTEDRDVGETASSLLQRIDEGFAKTPGVTPDLLKQYSTAREGWKNWIALTPNVVDANGNIMPKAFSKSLQKVYGDSYRLAGGADSLLPETQAGFRMAKVMAANPAKKTNTLVLAGLAGGTGYGLASNPSTILPAALLALGAHGLGHAYMGAPNALAGQIGGSLGAGAGSAISPDIYQLLGGK